MTDLDQKQEDRITALEKGQQEMLELLRPISETYRTVSSLGKWGMAAAVFVSILIGIIIGLRSVIPK